MKRFVLFLTGCLSVFLVACGGGSGGGGGSSNSQPRILSSESSQSADSSSSSSSAEPIALLPITRENTPYLVSATFDLLEFASGIEIDLYELHREISLIYDGRYTVACDNRSGTYSLRVESSRSKITETYFDCEIDGDYISGSRITEIFDQGAGQPYRVTQHWNNLKISSASLPTNFEELSGYMEYIGRIGNSYDNDYLYSIVMNASINSGSEGLLEVQNAEFILPYGFSSYPPASYTYFEGSQKYSATISWSGIGAANFSYDSKYKKIALIGSSDAKANVRFDQRLYMEWDYQGDGNPEAQSVIVIDVVDGGLSDALLNGSNEIVRTGANEVLLDGREIYMARGQTLEIDMRSFLGHTSGSLLDYGVSVNGDSSLSDNWQQNEAGKISLIFPTNVVDTTYDLIFYARDTKRENIYEIPVRFFVGSDYDQDNTPDAYDNDDDNDGFIDEIDEYPLNKKESKDTDKDGIADNADADADADGAPNFIDIYPLDASNCLNGLLDKCYKSGILNLSSIWFLSDENVLHFGHYYSALNANQPFNYVHRLDVSTGKFLLPIILPSLNNSRVFYSSDHSKIFTASTRNIYQTDVKSQESSLLLSTSAGFNIRYVEKNHLVLGHQLTPASDSLRIESYDFTGRLISSISGDDFLTPTVPQQYVKNCSSAITSTTEGYLWIHTNESGASCVHSSYYVVIGTNISYDGSLEYISGSESMDGGVYLIADNSLLVSIPASYQFYWLDNNYVLYSEGKITLYNVQGEELQSFMLDELSEFINIYTNKDTLLLVYRDAETSRVNIKAFDKTLNLMSTYGL